MNPEISRVGVKRRLLVIVLGVVAYLLAFLSFFLLDWFPYVQHYLAVTFLIVLLWGICVWFILVNKSNRLVHYWWIFPSALLVIWRFIEYYLPILIWSILEFAP